MRAAVRALEAGSGGVKEKAAAVEALCGYMRLLWQLSRANRGLLSVWRVDDGDASFVSMLRRIARVLDGVVAHHSSGRAADRAAAGRLAYFVVALLDGIGSSAGWGGGGSGKGGGAKGGGAKGGGAKGGGSDGMPLLLLGLAASGASWLRRGDEGLCSELLTIAFSSRVLSGALELAEGDLSEARGLLPVYMQMLGARRRRGEEDGRPSALRREATAGGGGSMLLPPDWLTAPLYRFEEGIGAMRLVTQVRATLWLLRALAERSVAAVSLVARSRLLCRGLAVFTLPDGTWREVRSELGALLRR